jgi:hypothetical protein
MLASVSSQRDKEGKFANTLQFAARYPQINWTDTVVPMPALSKLLTTGTIDTDNLALVEQHPLVAGMKTLPAWQRLWRWQILGEQEYREARAEIVEELRKFEFVVPAQILHVAGICLSLANAGDNILGQDVETYFENYFRILLENGNLTPDDQWTAERPESYGLGYHESGTKAFAKLLDLALTANQEAFEKSLQTNAKAMLQRISAEGGKEIGLLYEYEYEEDRPYRYAFLQYTDPSEFLGALIKDRAWNRSLGGALQLRYEHDMHAGRLAQEVDWALKLKERIESSIKEAKPPFAKALKQQSNNLLVKIDAWAVEMEKRQNLQVSTPTAAAASTSASNEL